MIRQIILEHVEDLLSLITGTNPMRLGPGPGCSKLTTSLVNVSLNFQKLISLIC